MLRIIIDAARTRDAEWTLPPVALEVACLLSSEEAVVLVLESGLLPSNYWRDSSSLIFEYVFSGQDRSKFGSLTRHLVVAGAEVVTKVADTWHMPTRKLQPLWQAFNALSAEGARVLVAKGALSKYYKEVSRGKEYLGLFDAIHERRRKIKPAGESKLLEIFRLAIYCEVANVRNLTALLEDMCYLGHLSCIRFLLEAGATAVPPKFLPTVFSISPLRNICELKNDHAEIVELLLSYGAYDDESEPYFHLCLQIAAKAHHPEVVRALLEKGSPLYTPEAFKSALVSVISKSGDATVEISELILDAWKATVGDAGDLDLAESLHAACCHGRVATAVYLLDQIPSPSSDLLAEALENACNCQDADASLSLVRMLLSRGGAEQRFIIEGLGASMQAW